MSKTVSFTPKDKMLQGINMAANAIGTTLGPKKQSVWIDDAVAPKFSVDGFSIASSIVFKDPQIESGNKIVKNACGQTVDDAGDGTTTTAVLMQSIIHEGLKRPESPMKIKESLLETLPKIVQKIKKQSKEIQLKDIKTVALISAENEELAENISQIFNKIGREAVITVEDSYDQGVSYDIVPGYEAHVGFMDPRFADPKDKNARCVMEDVPVIIVGKKISTVSDILPVIGKLQEKGENNCVIVCEDIDTPMLGLLLTNKLMGKFNSVVIRATGDLLKDIEAAVGATMISEHTGVSFQSFTLEHAGKAKKVTVDASKTIFIAENPQKAELYANHLSRFVDTEQNLYIKDKLKKRIAQLKGGVAVLKIGTQDFNREHLKDKADDAIKACKSALEEGVVVGGGQCLARIAMDLVPKTVGEEILKKALLAPFRKILENANQDYTQVILNGGLKGYDVNKDEYVDLFTKGIIDPTKVERCALENAVSNAAYFITMSVSITEELNEPTK